MFDIEWKVLVFIRLHLNSYTQNNTGVSRTKSKFDLNKLMKEN